MWFVYREILLGNSEEKIILKKCASFQSTYNMKINRL
jgi:hypothetical protein